jgi:hypothetical protein
MERSFEKINIKKPYPIKYNQNPEQGGEKMTYQVKAPSPLKQK